MIDSLIDFVKEEAKKMGAIEKEDYIFRNNTKADALNDNGAFFGFIRPDEEVAGRYSDFSLVFFPSKDETFWIIALGVGSEGFKNDLDLASKPGVKRRFMRLIDNEGFCKSDFLDIETPLPKEFVLKPNISHLKKTIATYTKVLPVVQILQDTQSNNSKQIILGFLATYAELRNWPSTANHRKYVADCLKPFYSKKSNDEEIAFNLLKIRKYLVLQGAPGTGKTRLAKLLSQRLNSEVFFTQFHAETNFADFVYGIKPDVNEKILSYNEEKGIFVKAIEFAISNPDKTVTLIIDEINRANLANVLGPIFYLFEYNGNEMNIPIQITSTISITKIPENLFVVCTMNTADRNLAIIDFALRRRFAWFTLKPKLIENVCFHKEEFIEIERIFEQYASSQELNLQPGHAYFIAKNDDEMTLRIKYELLPLIKEYLLEGLLLNAREEFNNFFLKSINESIFE